MECESKNMTAIWFITWEEELWITHNNKKVDHKGK